MIDRRKAIEAVAEVLGDHALRAVRHRGRARLSAEIVDAVLALQVHRSGGKGMGYPPSVASVPLTVGGMPSPVPTPITDEMVERAARVFEAYPSSPEALRPDHDYSGSRHGMREALDAALNGGGR